MYIDHIMYRKVSLKAFKLGQERPCGQKNWNVETEFTK